MTTYLPWPGRPTEAGEIIDLPDDVARRYLASGQAELVAGDPPRIEAAVLAKDAPNAARDMRPAQLKRR